MDSAYFTIGACNRCRKRKARCDTGIPACLACQNSGAICEYINPINKEWCPRSQIIDLERQLSQLETRVSKLRQQHAAKGSLGPDIEGDTAIDEVSEDDDGQPGVIRYESEGDGHYLGASSGLNLARSVLRSARRYSTAFESHGGRKQHVADAGSMCGHESSQARPQPEDSPLPLWEKTRSLVRTFFRQFEVQYPILIQEKFMQDIAALYSALDRGQEVNPWSNFMLRTVLSISLHLASQESEESARLSKSFRHSAVSELGKIMGARNDRTLQCLLLLLLSSIHDSRSAPMWYISGICMRMCVDLGYHTEQTIAHAETSISEVEVDTKRRLFWVTYNFDRSLAAMLGRPFFIDDEQIDVCLPGPSLPKEIRSSVSHWLNMKRIECELVRPLLMVSSQRGSLSAMSNSISSDWTAQMESKLTRWIGLANGLEPVYEGSSSDLWEYCYARARLMLHRPGPMRPVPTTESISAAYDSAMTMIHLSFVRAQKSPLELTWLDLHSHLVSGLSLLFVTLNSSEGRSMAHRNWSHFSSCVVEWQTVLDKFAARWDAIAKTKNVLNRLADEILQNTKKHRSNDQNHPQGETVAQGADKAFPPISKSSVKLRSHLSITSSQPQSNAYNGHRPGCGEVEQTNEASPNFNHTSPPLSSNLGRQNDYYYQSHDDFSYTQQEDERQGRSSEPLFDKIDFSSFLGDSFLVGLEQLDIPLQPYLDTLSHPQTGLDPLVPFVMGGSNEQLDSTLTDSVLNFHDGLEAGEMNM